MAVQIHVLLVGINDYPRHVGKLYGCRNDVQHVHDDLLDTYGAAVRKRAGNPDPQFEIYRGFLACAGFPGNRSSHVARRFGVSLQSNRWPVDCGALHGLPRDPEKAVEVVILPESHPLRSDAHASTTQVGDSFERHRGGLAEKVPSAKNALPSGLSEDDDRQLAPLVHSTGGLVSRWFIEREGGNRRVDRMLMSGTPNVASPFGEADIARRPLSLLSTLALNTFSALAPFGAVLLCVLLRCRRITPTLDETNRGSDFLRMLDIGDDPAVPYTIAGVRHARCTRCGPTIACKDRCRFPSLGLLPVRGLSEGDDCRGLAGPS